MSKGGLRLRSVVSGQIGILILVFLLITAAGGYLTYGAYVQSETTTEERTVSQWEVQQEFDHSATVTRDNTVFALGTVLDGRNTYFGNIAPKLDGSFSTGYTGESDGVEVTESVTLVYRSVDEDTGTVYWSEEQELTETATEDLPPDESTNSNFTINTSAVNSRLGDINSELGSDPGSVEIFVEAETQFSGTVDGQSVDQTYTNQLPIDIGTDTYTVDDPGEATDEFTQSETVSVPVEPSPIERYGGPILLVLGLLGSALLAVAYRNGGLELTDAEREYLSYQQDLTQFDEWIVRVSLPESVFDRPVARAASLADLADFAIDSNNPVVEDPETGTYYVVDDDAIYRFDPPAMDESEIESLVSLFEVNPTAEEETTDTQTDADTDDDEDSRPDTDDEATSPIK